MTPRTVLLLALGSSCSLATACAGGGDLRCGPGTHREGDLCLPDGSDGGLDGGCEPDGSDGDVADDADVDTDAEPACLPIAVPPSTPGSISCEGVTCETGTICEIGSGYVGRCVDPELADPALPLRECDEAADCGGGICCLMFRYSGPWAGTTTTCEDSCPYGPSTQMCTTDAECGAEGSCDGWSVSAGRIEVATCRPPIGC